MNFLQKTRVWVVGKISRLRLPLFLCGLAAVAGILCAEARPDLPFWTWVLGATLALLLAAKMRSSITMVLLATALCYGVAFRASDHNPLRDHLLKREGRPVSVDVIGMVSSSVEPDPGGPDRWRFSFRAEKLNGETVPGIVLVGKVITKAPPAYGQRLQIHGLLRGAVPPRNPGEFDYADFLRREGFTGELRIPYPDDIEVLSSGHGWKILEWAFASRKWIGEVVTRELDFDPAIAATVRAMVLGTQEKTPAEIE